MSDTIIYYLVKTYDIVGLRTVLANHTLRCDLRYQTFLQISHTIFEGHIGIIRYVGIIRSSRCVSAETYDIYLRDRGVCVHNVLCDIELCQC